MPPFIEVTRLGQNDQPFEISLNVDKVISITKVNDSQCSVLLDGGATFKLAHPHDHVMTLIGNIEQH